MASDVSQDAPAAQPPLDPGVLEVIRWSAGWLSRVEDAFIAHLQADIAALIPDLAMDGRAFCERMVRSLLWAAMTDDSPHLVVESLRWVGGMNRLEGFPEEQYVNVAHALVRAVHDLSGTHWFTSMGSAWISYFLWVRPHLLVGAQQAAVQQAAQQAAAQQAAAQQAAARQAARAKAQAQAMAQGSGGEVDLESVAGLLDDEDDEEEEAGYGQIMVSMTRPPRRDRHPR